MECSNYQFKVILILIKYQFKKMQKVQKNMQEDYLQLIKNDGIHADILTDLDNFERCQICQTIFKVNFAPMLLSCGHFVCILCRGHTNQCFLCSPDGVEVSLKIASYKKLLSLRMKANEEQTYLFRINLVHTHQMSQCTDVTLKMTPSQIINKFDFMFAFIKISEDNNQSIRFRFNGQAFSYLSVKDIPLKDIKSKSGNPLLIRSGDFYNIISLSKIF